MSSSHFNQRCRERGITTTDLDTLLYGICWAVEKGRDDICEKVLTYRDGRYWRFRCPDGVFYAVTGLKDPRPRTVITQEMLRKKKWAKKQSRKGTGRP